MSDPSSRLRGMKKLHLPHIQITQAAFHIYAAQGPKGLTMRKVAAAVGVRASALYRHFLNKEALMDAVAVAADRALAEKLRAPPKQKKRKSRTRPLIARALEFAVEQPRLFRLASTHRPRWDEQSCAAPSMVLREVEQAIENGELRKGDAKAHATAVWAQICGLAAIRERGDLPSEPRALRQSWFSTARAVVDGLRAA
jgi:AcrR family transcriptional regulator